MNYFEILILAIIQGAAEMLPVSSSAHVILTAKLLGHDPSSSDFVFLLVMLHTGTMVAVLFYFWPRWRWLFSSSHDSAGHLYGSRRQFLLMLVLASACTVVLGFGLKFAIEKVIFQHLLGHTKGELEELFKNLYLMAGSLFVVGIMIILAGLRESTSSTNTISTRSSLWIGIVQGLCLPFRGLSRSGATISTALFCGISRPLAEDFSFALAVILTPGVIGYSLYKLLKAHSLSDLHLGYLLLPGLVGMVFSFIAGFLALKVLSAALEKGRWKYFGYYCVFASLVVLSAAISGL